MPGSVTTLDHLDVLGQRSNLMHGYTHFMWPRPCWHATDKQRNNNK